ncbi:MAG: hypothetical protein ACRDTH_17550 [Pseudonocardiaceae bacterium]
MAMDTSPDLPGVAAAGDGILHALWTLLAAQLSCLAKETWLRASVDIAANTAFAHGMADDRVIAVAAMESGCALLLSETLPAVGRLRVTQSGSGAAVHGGGYRLRRDGFRGRQPDQERGEN